VGGLVILVGPGCDDVPEVVAHRVAGGAGVVGGDPVADAAVHPDDEPALVAALRQVAAPDLEQHLAHAVVQHEEQLVVGRGCDRAVEGEVVVDALLEVVALVLE